MVLLVGGQVLSWERGRWRGGQVGELRQRCCCGKCGRELAPQADGTGPRRCLKCTPGRESSLWMCSRHMGLLGDRSGCGCGCRWHPCSDWTHWEVWGLGEFRVLGGAGQDASPWEMDVYAGGGLRLEAQRCLSWERTQEEEGIRGPGGLALERWQTGCLGFRRWRS